MIGGLRRNFLTGVVAIAPLAITLWVLWRFYEFISGTMRPWVQRVPALAEAYPEFFLTIAGIVVIVLLVTLVGVLARNLVGVAFFRLVERVVQRIPVVKSMYSGTKQIAAVLLQDRRTAFKHVVLFAYPRPGVYALGFITSDLEDGDAVAVFLPTTPNPTSGFMLLVPRDEVRRLDMPVEEAIKLIVAGGSIMEPGQAGSLETEIGKLEAARNRQDDQEVAP
ncbi:MAG: DUF502 domain-containing protein [bacterium]|nr:DUF502 domain-containing protein [bacterium]